MTPNFLLFAFVALIPSLIGFVWYHPKVFGTIWMREANLKQENLKDVNMFKVLSLSYIYSYFICIMLTGIVIHQGHIYSILMNDPSLSVPGSELNKMVTSFMSNYGLNFRTFKHGTLHGALAGIFFAFPIIAINSLFENKSFKYTAIHSGYWILSIALMGGLICQFS